MYILVAGAGEVGTALARSLTASRHNVVCVDSSREVCEALYARHGITTHCGSGNDIEILRNAVLLHRGRQITENLLVDGRVVDGAAALRAVVRTLIVNLDLARAIAVRYLPVILVGRVDAADVPAVLQRDQTQTRQSLSGLPLRARSGRHAHSGPEQAPRRSPVKPRE